MSAGPRSMASVFLPFVAASLALVAVTAGAQTSAPSPESLRERRVQLFVNAGRQPLKQMASDVFQFATESERCRVSYGSKACGLPSDSLKSGDVEQVFDYYVRQPTNTAIDQQRPSIQKQDWDWNPGLGRPADASRDKQ
jgi:hypothetical protein